MSRCKKILLRCLAIFGCVSVCADSFPAVAEEGKHEVTVQSTDGRVATGVLATLSRERLVVTGKVPGELKIGDVIRIDFPSRKPAGLGGRNLILLANGDRLVANPLGSNEESLRIQMAQSGPFDVPLEVVRGIAWQLPQDRVSRRRILQALERHVAKTDEVLLRNGNRVSGEFLGLKQSKLQFETAAGTREIKNSSIQGLAFNPDLIDFSQSDDIRALVTLDDGSRFTVREFGIKSGEQFECAAVFGAKLSIAVSRIVSLQILGGGAVYLSDLQPAKYEFTPFLSLKWPLRKDRNSVGGPLRLKGREYAKGLGTHSKCAVSYALNKRYSRFQATVGIDDGAGGKGNALVQVLLDGKPVLTSTPLLADAAPLVIAPIDVSGANLITLFVDYGDLGDVQDHVNWCDALLVQELK